VRTIGCALVEAGTAIVLSVVLTQVIKMVMGSIAEWGYLVVVAVLMLINHFFGYGESYEPSQNDQR
jgi:hypothetical protein